MTVCLFSNYGKTLRISSVPCTSGAINFLQMDKIQKNITTIYIYIKQKVHCPRNKHLESHKTSCIVK